MKTLSIIPRSKKGVALELAIVFMVVIFALCSVLTTVSVSTRMRDKRITDKSNEYFILDQAGEYFIKAVQKMGAGNDKLSEAYYNSVVSEIASEQQTSEMTRLTKYVKNIAEDYEIQLFENTVDEANDIFRFTMKIWNKKEYASAESSVSGSGAKLTPLLIVSVDRIVEGRNVNYEIRNWSDQENRLNYVDAKTKIDRNSRWGWLLGLLLVLITVVVICVICLI